MRGTRTLHGSSASGLRGFAPPFESLGQASLFLQAAVPSGTIRRSKRNQLLQKRLSPAACRGLYPFRLFSLIPANQSPLRPLPLPRMIRIQRARPNFLRTIAISSPRFWKAHEQAASALSISHWTHLPLTNSRARFSCKKRLRNKACSL